MHIVYQFCISNNSFKMKEYMLFNKYCQKYHIICSPLVQVLSHGNMDLNYSIQIYKICSEIISEATYQSCNIWEINTVRVTYSKVNAIYTNFNVVCKKKQEHQSLSCILKSVIFK